MGGIADIIVEALPWLPGFVDTATVTVTAIPGVVAGLSTGAYFLLGAGFLAWAWHELYGQPWSRF